MAREYTGSVTAFKICGISVEARSPCSHCAAVVTEADVRRALVAMIQRHDDFGYRCSVCGERIHPREALVIHHSKQFDGTILPPADGWAGYVKEHEPYVEISVFRNRFVPEYVYRVMTHVACFALAHPHGPITLKDPSVS